MSSKRPDPIDIQVGHRIRIQRVARGMSQSALADQIGVTFQQVQKYEKGANRVGASRLNQIANVLGVSLPSLFDGAPTATEDESGHSPRYLLSKPHSLRLLQGFEKIGNEGTRLALLQLVECLSQDAAHGGGKPKGARK